jgi:ABC-type transport system substrate-binding protein
MSFASPIPHEALEAYADKDGNLANNAIGTGPFRLRRWSRGSRIVLDKHPEYRPEFYPKAGSAESRRKGMLADAGRIIPFLDRVVFHVIKDPEEAWELFLKGELDHIALPQGKFDDAITAQTNLSPELSSRGIRLSIDTGTRFFYLSFNQRDKVVGGQERKLLRQAISSAVNRERWIEIVSKGRGKKATTALPPGIADRPTETTIKYDYNPERAKELLAKAGFKDGRGLPELRMDMRGADTFNRRLGEFFKDQFARVGLRLRVIYNTFPVYIDKLRKADLQISYSGWGMDYPDAENVYQLLYGRNVPPGSNDSCFDHPEMNKLYQQMSRMDAGAPRAKLIARMDEILQEEMPWALGYYHADYHLIQPWLLNYRGIEIIANKYKYVRVNREAKQRYLESR